MKLRAKKPEIKQTRFKALIYGNAGSGKTHFCCSFPSPYYIDTEGLEDYEHFQKMIIDNKGDIVKLNHLEEIIEEIKALLSTKHDYKTLIIDSISFPYTWLAQAEIERLTKRSPNTEGTEFGANIAKGKRLAAKIGILLSQLDMNVIVISHEKTKFENGKELGHTFDISDKLAYSLGAVLRIIKMGKSRKLFVAKSRYTQLQGDSMIDFDDQYKIIENLFGKEIFYRESSVFDITSEEQLKELDKLIVDMNINEDTQKKWLKQLNASSFEFVEKDKIQKLLDHLKSKLEGEIA